MRKHCDFSEAKANPYAGRGRAAINEGEGMPRSVSYNKRLSKHLKNTDEAAVYLNAVLVEGDSKLFLKALGKVAKAEGGIGQSAAKIKVFKVGISIEKRVKRGSRAKFLKAMSKVGNAETDARDRR